MIPSEQDAKTLWEKYNLPEKKRVHVMWIAKLAQYFSEELQKRQIGSINDELLLAGCLLHDIDKNIPRLPGEMHPDTGVRILKAEGMEEVAELIKNHSVQNIENPLRAPKTWEEKLLFLSDKMVKQEIIGVDKRFEEWLAEDDLPEIQKEMLRRVYPLVKSLEHDVFTKIDSQLSDIKTYIR